MRVIKPIDANLLYPELNPDDLPFKTTLELKTIREFVGQARAFNAIKFGIDIKSHCYHIFAMGSHELNKKNFVTNIIKHQTRKQQTPPDWCYLHNFDIPEKPIPLALPPGTGLAFQKDMETMIETFAKNIVSSHKKEKILKLKLILPTLKPLTNKLKDKYGNYPLIVHYLSDVQKDIFKHAHDLVRKDEKKQLLSFIFDSQHLMKYTVNLLVDNSKTRGAPIIYEESPSYANLVGHVESQPEGICITSHGPHIKPGSLHKANGGYLIIRAANLKKNREAWDALKTVLSSREIKINHPTHDTDVSKLPALQPEPIPLDVKVILLGERSIYYYFCYHDTEFTDLFKVIVDFDEQIDRNKQTIRAFAELIGSIIKKQGLRPFHASAVAAVINYSSRLAEDNEKLSTHLLTIQDIIFEADFWASQSNKKIVEEKEVKKALQEQIYRADRSKDLYYEDILRDFIIINTSGESIGQVNCLSVRKVGAFSYGHPTRVTARISRGKGNMRMIDIQREIKMAGSMHSKAGLVIAHFLMSRFGQQHLLDIVASISFEQLYCWTDGDSASVGELCALLSALSDVPIDQSLAITGSIDQYGQVQAISGVNEKIEGFFDICQARKLDSKQGVLIPSVNQKNLILREDIVQAVREKKFFIYLINNIDEAIALLTGLPDSEIVYDKIVKRLQQTNL